MLEEAIKEAQSLKLPENRLRVQVGIADLLWSKDEKRARALFKEAISGFDEIARAAAAIDPAQSFEILKGMIEQFNLLVGASATLDAFEGRHQFREGEMVLKGSGAISSMIQYWSNDLQQLAREDFDRALISCDRFQRSEVRLMIRLSIARGVLSDGVETSEYPGKDFYRYFLNRARID